MAHEAMTSRERWLAVLSGRKPDRLPLDYWATAEADEKLRRHLGCASRTELEARLHLDRPLHLAPRYIGPPPAPDQDIYGCRYRDVAYSQGVYRECVSHPLADFDSVEAIEAGYRWPQADWFDVSGLPAQAAGQKHLPLAAGGSEPFLTYKNLRGDEQAFMDLLLNPEIVDYCLDKLFGLAYEQTCRIYEQLPGSVTYSYVAEDMGGEQSLMIAPDLIRRFLLPRMKRMVDLAHQAGVYVFHHNDGAIRAILPDLIAMGIDLLNPIQWRCRGMDRATLKQDFGRAVVFHGGMDNQVTLPFGSLADVRQEVADNIRLLGAGGGYILAPCHNIQAVSPPENIVAMYETAYALGRDTAG
ncbi:MAG: uroporphyrinogen-III decarboxylase-like protein [Clostridiaceae bacterium]|nr:uroporphyrinogen-III decarboxylase-like protein [Clostridiaceae bacterium]